MSSVTWLEADRPPYTGQWWAYTKHGTVEMVDVDYKNPKHLGKADQFGARPDPFLYHFGEGCTGNMEAVGSNRWTHWTPVLPPEPPTSRVNIEGDPAPTLKRRSAVGKSVEHHLLEKTMAEYTPATDFSARKHGGHNVRGPHKMAQQANQRDGGDGSKDKPLQGLPLGSVGLDWRREAIRGLREEIIAMVSRMAEYETQMSHEAESKASSRGIDFAAEAEILKRDAELEYELQKQAHERMEQTKAQDEMDQRDASAYEPKQSEPHGKSG